MGIHRSGNIRLAAADNNAVVPSFLDVNEHVRVFLLAGRYAPVALDIGHGTRNTEIVFLNVFQPFPEPLVIVRAMLLVDFICGAERGVNSVHPGAMETPMIADMLRDKTIRATVENAHPIGFLGKPIDIAYAVLYLASEESRMVTGAEMVIDGGWLAR